MQCNVEFGYQLSICSGTKENLDRVGRSQDLPNANWLLASSPALNPWALTLVPILCCCFLLFPAPPQPVIFFYNYLYMHMIWIGTKLYKTHMEGINAYVNNHAYKYTYLYAFFFDYRYIWESIVVWKIRCFTRFVAYPITKTMFHI
jgi:hypothetical protein